MNKKLLTLIIAAVVLFAGVAVMQTGNIGAKAIWSASGGGSFLLPLVSIAALIDSINPCAFSILLLTIAFLFSLGRARPDILKIGGAYIFGLFLVYIFIGLGIIQTLHLFNTPHFMAKLGAGLLVALGLINIINHFFPRFPIKLKIPQAAHKKIAELMESATLPTAFLLGALVGICEFPCTGGPYLMILGLLHDKATYLKGFAYLIWYNLLFILPLVIILAIASQPTLLAKVQAWKKAETGQMKIWAGIAMIILGIIIFAL
jgi:cytochrome c biogenesis protein CcdA